MRWSFPSSAMQVLSVILLSACIGDDAPREKNSEVGHWALEENLRIGQAEGAPEFTFGEVGKVLPGPAGGIWVMESQIPELRLYDTRGAFVRTVGRRGEGPGEFTPWIVCAFPGPGGEVWVEDGLKRWQRFDSTGVLIGVTRATTTLMCGAKLFTTDGRLLAGDVSIAHGSHEHRNFFVDHRRAQDGALVPGDTFFNPNLPEPKAVVWQAPGQRISKVIPFTHRPIAILSQSGDFWLTTGDGTYVIEKRTPAGKTLLRIRRPHTPVEIPDSIREHAIRDFEPKDMIGTGNFNPDQVPRVYPPFDRFQEATDGTLWVWRQLDNDVRGIDVYAPDGTHLATVDVPKGFGGTVVQHITRDYIYGVTRGELDVPLAVRMAIRRPATN